MRKERNRGRRKYASQKEQPSTKKRKIGEGEVQEVWTERGRPEADKYEKRI